MKKTVYLYHHLGLGDHIICNGLVRNYANKFNIKLFTKSHNAGSVKFMYKDVPTIDIISVQNDQETQNRLNYLNDSNNLNPTGTPRRI